MPSKNRNASRDVSRQNARNIALARSPLPLSFIPPSPSPSRSSERHGKTEDDFYKTFLKAQIDELQDKIDDIDGEFTSLTRQAFELSTQVTNFEGEIVGQVEAVRNAPPQSLEFENLSEVVRMSNIKLSAARSQLTQALIAKSERLKRLEAYKKELDERKFLLQQHESKPVVEKSKKGARKLKSSLEKARK